MPVLNCYSHQKSVRYNTILEDEICFSDNISSVIQKIGMPENTEKYDNQTTLKYKRELNSRLSTVSYCFNQEKLCSVCYESNVLTDDESKLFLSEMENIISNTLFDSVIRYTCCGKDYWELSDGAVSMHICLYIENNIAHIKIDFSDLYFIQ